VTVWTLETPADAAETFTFRILAGSTRTIGRDAVADFILDTGMVSRIHCRVSAGAAELEVVDLDSTNGTYVNGQRVARGLLKDGDQLGLGRVVFRVSRSDS
jgi:pSer/pThr/pTyr-binding forkhead associated (FHA) protein